MDTTAPRSHTWRFFRTCGLDQALLQSGDDLADLASLDQKLWTALSCPTRGVRFDAKTLALLDSDNDGRIRVPELLAAIAWLSARLTSLDPLLAGSDTVMLASITTATPEGKAMLANAKRILSNLGKGAADAISLADVADTALIRYVDGLTEDAFFVDIDDGESFDLATSFLLAQIIHHATEHRSQLHTATLASIHAGLRDIGPYLSEVADMARAAAAGALRYIRDDCVRDGHLIKYVRNDAVDASLLWLALPFEVYAVDDPVMLATAERIEHELLGGGVRRYLADTYYGGGEWVILTAWLAWYRSRAGRRDDAHALMRWIEEQRDEHGALPEQVPGADHHPRFLAYWTREWGPSARPLLWSHAMTAVVKAELT